VIEESIASNQIPAEALSSWLVRELSQILDISPEAVATNVPFSFFGLDSAKAVGLMHRLGALIGRKLAVALAWEYPTIAALAAHLCDTRPPERKGSPAHSFSSRAWNEPVAVIGMACRLPGARDPAAFWDLLRSGRSAFREITSDRWDLDAWYDPDLGRPGKMN
jgi:acyl carrier protein